MERLRERASRPSSRAGQQQRVALARSHRRSTPDVLLLDEPLSNLDAKLREEMRAFITDLQKRLNITTLFVTHDQVEAIELADQIGVMFDGVLQQFGTPEEIFNRPRTPRIADFMGATNLIEGTLDRSDDGGSIMSSSIGTLTSAHRTHHGNAAPVTATVRPEHVELTPKGEADAAGTNRIDATIADAVYYGGTVSYTLRSGPFSLQVKDRSTRRYNEGEEVIAHIQPEHLWIFPDADDRPS